MREGWGEEFEAAFRRASSMISSAPGHASHELQRRVEIRDRCVLLVRWETLRDHTEGFRRSEGYGEWKRLLHHFYGPFPIMEHFALVHGGRSESS